MGDVVELIRSVNIGVLGLAEDCLARGVQHVSASCFPLSHHAHSDSLRYLCNSYLLFSASHLSLIIDSPPDLPEMSFSDLFYLWINYS